MSNVLKQGERDLSRGDSYDLEDAVSEMDFSN